MYSPRTITERKFASSFSCLRETKEQELHIISAGPSVRNFNWQTIRHKDIMTINDSIFYIPLKVRYHIYNEPFEKEKENYIKMTKKYPYVHKFTTFDIRGWNQIKLYDDENLAFMLAINLAIDLQYKKVILYGYDFDCIGGFIHWWDKFPEDDLIKLESKKSLVKKQKILFDKFVDNTKDKIDMQIIKVYNG